MKITKFVICIENSDYPASLEKRKIYQALPDSEAGKTGYIRVVDESGEDYIYPASWFVEVDFDERTRNALTEAA